MFSFDVSEESATKKTRDTRAVKNRHFWKETSGSDPEASLLDQMSPLALVAKIKPTKKLSAEDLSPCSMYDEISPPSTKNQKLNRLSRQTNNKLGSFQQALDAYKSN